MGQCTWFACLFVYLFIFNINLGNLWGGASQSNCLCSTGGVQKDVVMEQVVSHSCSDQTWRAGHRPPLGTGKVSWRTLCLWHSAEPGVTHWLHCPQQSAAYVQVPRSNLSDGALSETFGGIGVFGSSFWVERNPADVTCHWRQEFFANKSHCWWGYHQSLEMEVWA